MQDGAEYWDDVYKARVEEDLSWHEDCPSVSLALVRRLCPNVSARIVDVGAGTSRLVDLLLERGYLNLTVLDISPKALAQTRDRLGDRCADVTFVAANVLDSGSLGQFDLWHDRALFHFLTAESDQSRYAEAATAAVAEGGHLAIFAFALDGPDSCSNLPVCRHDAASLMSIFETNFDLVTAERVEHSTPWGAVQPFTVSVFRRLGLSPP